MAAYYRPRYYRWHRPSRGSVPMPVVIGAGALIAALAATGTAKVTHTHIPVINPAPASQYAPHWASAFLHKAHLPGTACDRAAVVAWIGAEGSNPAWFNPLDSTQSEPGSHAINPVGVQAYTSRRQGIEANAVTIRNGYYPGVLAALEAGQDAQAVADAVAQSPWGTAAFTASC